MKPRILLIEDDRNIAQITKENLEDAGYEAVHCKEGAAALEWLKTNPVQLIVCDIQLPGISGIKLCEILRQNETTATIPILMLTVLDDEKYKVESLQTGADDYLVKPFSVKELTARVQALLRRSLYQGRTDRKLTAKDIEVDLDREDVLVKGKKVKLLPKELDLLVLFLKKQGHVLTYQHIADTVWGMDQIATRDTIKVWIHHLREKIEPLADHIQAVSGKGYKWE